MISIPHKFLNHRVAPDTETLIVGTFNPDTPENPADFFYGRSRNFLWRLLPTAFDESDLKMADKSDKLNFIKRHKIDLIDLISEVEVEEGQGANYDDKYIDGRVIKWRDVISEIDRLKNLKRICITRKTFNDIPNMKERIIKIQEHCQTKGILFQALLTPARNYTKEKQIQWTNFLLHDSR